MESSISDKTPSNFSQALMTPTAMSPGSQTAQEFKPTKIWREDLKAFHVARSSDALIGSKSPWLNSTN